LQPILKTHTDKFELGLSESLLKAILDLGFENPTEYRRKRFPIIGKKDTDMVALAQTGTGKTAAFGFQLFRKLMPTIETQALILSPTRELCLQITNEIKLLEIRKGINVVAIYGGASITDQAEKLREAQIIVATQEECKT
jgi:ATP-dependent RNA helicase DeaD